MAADIRVRRLHADHQAIQGLASRTSLITFEAERTSPQLPPEKYRVRYGCRGIAKLDSSREPIFSTEHAVEIYLHSEYPRQPPRIIWLTPIWHPDVSVETGEVCINCWPSGWNPSMFLDDLCILLARMIQYKLYSPPQPAVVNPQAAEWCERYARANPGFFPTDNREIVLPGGETRQAVGDMNTGGSGSSRS